MKKRLLSKLRQAAAWMLLVLPFAAISQDNKILTGKVTDSKDGSPISGISVLAVGTGGKKAGTATGTDGTFRLVMPPGTSKVILTGTGFEKQEIDVTGKASIDVSMVAGAASTLNDVVVVGYGTARRRDLTGSVSSLTPKNFNQGVITSPDQLLQSKVSGLEVTNTSGQPGAAPTIQIRGTSSIRSNNNPLYVVDGVPLDGASARPNLGSTFGSTPSSNPLLFIDPNSIAQIDVLKDASSSAIYGARGANGVIMITTKKGGAGPMKMEVGTSWGTNVGYMKRFGILNASQFVSALTKYGQPSTLNGGANVDALDAITQGALSQSYSVAFSGGNEVGKFRASFLANDQKGFLKKSGLGKYLATMNGDYKFLDNKLSIGFGLIAGNYGETLTNVSNTTGSEGSLISAALSWNPTIALRNASGLYNFPSNGSGNPLAFSDAYNDKSNVTELLANFTAGYKITDNLEYKFLYGVNYGTGSRNLNVDGWISGVAQISGKGFAAKGGAELFSQLFTHTLNYHANLQKDLRMDALVGYEYFKTDFSGSTQTATGFNTNLDYASRISIPYTSIMQDAKTQNPSSPFVNPTAEIQSYFARVNFNLQDKYLLTATIRRDGSSKFGANNKYGNFPSVGAKWVVSNESFMKDSKTFSNVALRASWGITGNQEFPAGSSQEQFALTSNNNAPQVVNGNPDLKWESTKASNIGLDFGLLKGRIAVSIDYYNKNTSDILFQTTAIQPAPSSISFVNLKNANLINSGVELSINAGIIDHKNFAWDLGFNYAYNKNNVKNFIDPLTGLNLQINTGQVNGQGVSGTLAQVIANNHPVNVFFLKPFQGFDATGNQKIGGTADFAGDPNPQSMLGVSNTFRYKKFTFSVNMGGAFGFLIYNNTATNITNIAGIVQGRNIDLAAYNSGEGVGSGVGASTRFLEKGDYLKLRNATLRYNVGNVGKYVKGLTAFVSGTNLFVITKFTGFDPEVNIDKSNNGYPSRSIEYVPYPTARNISFGLNFSL